MGMAYRGDVEALEARVAALSADVAQRVRERDEAAQLLAEARARANAEAYLADLDAGGPARRRRKKLRIAAMTAGFAMVVGGLVAAYRVHSHKDHHFEEAMQTFERFADEMCQCKDTACLTHVSDAMNVWGMRMSKEWGPEPKLDDVQMKRATSIGERMGQCMSRVMNAGDPQQLAQ